MTAFASGFFASGRVADLVLGLLALEAVLLLAYHRRTGRGIPAPVLLPNLLAGACLVLALRAALTGAHWGWTALALLAALAAHGLDLGMLWRQTGSDRRH